MGSDSCGSLQKLRWERSAAGRQLAVADSEIIFCWDCALHFRGFRAVRNWLRSFARKHQGQGYAREAIAALLQRPFVDWQRYRVTALRYVRNTGAAKLLAPPVVLQEAHFVKHARFKGPIAMSCSLLCYRRSGWRSTRLDSVTN